jgi:phenylacetate-CoA ligase
MNWVHELRLKQWFGLPPGVKEARLSALSSEYWDQSQRSSAREWLWNQMILPGYFLSDREYAHTLQKIRKFRPRVLWGPTQALTGLARYVQRENEDISSCRPDLIISRAAPLYPHEKALLTVVFGCPVTNMYGTREVGHVAMNCPHGSVHVNQENYFVEIEGSGSSEGHAGPGRILITPLFEMPMPFIRYRIGDIVEMGAGDCPCGRSLPVIAKILGRLGDVFTTSDGRLIDPNFWCIAFEVGRLSRDIERFQVVYRRNDCIRLRIVPRRSYSAETEAAFRNFVDTNFMAAIQVEFEYVPEILPQPSGKFLFVVNEIEKQEQQPAHV